MVMPSVILMVLSFRLSSFLLKIRPTPFVLLVRADISCNPLVVILPLSRSRDPMVIFLVVRQMLLWRIPRQTHDIVLVLSLSNLLFSLSTSLVLSQYWSHDALAPMVFSMVSCLAVPSFWTSVKDDR